MTDVSIRHEGRRHYIVGDTYKHRETLRDAGCHWDGDRREWWIGESDAASDLVDKLNHDGACVAAAPPKQAANSGGDETIVAGRGEYNGKTYYLVGRIRRGRTHWDDRVDATTSRDGTRMLLVYRDGSRTFWADAAAVNITRRYDKPKTISSLRSYAGRAKSFGTEECRCSCHRESNAGRPGSILYDGCDRCGCEAV